MLCYRDMTFCPFDDCKYFYHCYRALTESVKAKAKVWWNGDNEAPIAKLSTKPKCFKKGDV